MLGEGHEIITFVPERLIASKGVATGPRPVKIYAAPDLLARAWNLDWSDAIVTLRSAANLYVIGRGLGLGVAQEAALKLKETCGLHAEAFSAAELRHGPMALVGAGFPVLAFAQHDETHAGLLYVAAELAGMGATVMLAGGESAGAISLPCDRADPALEPILQVQSFYRLVNSLALARDRNPDHPPHLHKVTATL